MDVQARISELLEQESTHPEVWLYLSFADKTFLGAVILKARGVTHAVNACWQKQINPGGEVLCFEIPKDKVPPEKYQNRLLTLQEIREFWPTSKSIREWEARK